MPFDLGPAFVMQRGRSIGTIIPDVTIDEFQSDSLRVTDHPVEKGAAISDHAFKMPAEVEMKIGFSNSTGGYESYIDEAYELLLALQKSRKPFDVSTGKRAYRNMLITTLAVQTDHKSENALFVTVGLREVIIAETQSTSAPSAAANKADQSAPQTTGSVLQLGQRPLATLDNGAPTFAQVTTVQYAGTPYGAVANPSGPAINQWARPAGVF